MNKLEDNYLVAGKKIYAKCNDCGKLVQINKFILGSLHICINNIDNNAKDKEGVKK